MRLSVGLTQIVEKSESSYRVFDSIEWKTYIMIFLSVVFVCNSIILIDK